MAWQGSSNADSKYTYLDKDGAKDAPSALHSVVIPDVNLPKVRFIRVGIGGWNTDGLCRSSTSASTSGVRRDTKDEELVIGMGLRVHF
jgi:hypothetical protein